EGGRQGVVGRLRQEGERWAVGGASSGQAVLHRQRASMTAKPPPRSTTWNACGAEKCAGRSTALRSTHFSRSERRVAAAPSPWMQKPLFHSGLYTCTAECMESPDSSAYAPPELIQ